MKMKLKWTKKVSSQMLSLNAEIKMRKILPVDGYYLDKTFDFQCFLKNILYTM